MSEPLRCLTLFQPWAWLVANEWKDAENRPRVVNLRGPTLIHAARRRSKAAEAEAYKAARAIIRRLPKDQSDRLQELLPSIDDIERGGIVGVMDIDGDTRTSSAIRASRWFVGPEAYHIAAAQPLAFEACRGFQGVWFYKGTLHAGAGEMLRSRKRGTNSPRASCPACQAFAVANGQAPMPHFLVACECP